MHDLNMNCTCITFKKVSECDWSSRLLISDLVLLILSMFSLNFFIMETSLFWPFSCSLSMACIASFSSLSIISLICLYSPSRIRLRFKAESWESKTKCKHGGHNIKYIVNIRLHTNTPYTTMKCLPSFRWALQTCLQFFLLLNKIFFQTFNKICFKYNERQFGVVNLQSDKKNTMKLSTQVVHDNASLTKPYLIQLILL